MVKPNLSSQATLGFLTCALLASGCAPKTNDLGTATQDLTAVTRDMAASCTAITGNLLVNGDFETGPNGTANNIDKPNPNPASSIPGGWTGCCGTTATTQYTVLSTMAHCGLRAVQAQSTSAVANVLYQPLMLAAQAGQTFHLSAAVLVTQPSAGGTILLDMFDLSTNSIVASTTQVSTTPNGWFALTPVVGTIPTGGKVQVRINTNGNITTLVDDVALTVP